MKIAIYPGSFDPITSGHLNIIRRAANIFDRLVVCVMVNASKKPMFTQRERVDMIRSVVHDIPNVEVDASGALLAEYARDKGRCVIVKGLRAGSDLDTMFLTSEHQYMYLSSSTVKELGMYDVDLSDFLPEQIIPVFKKRIKEIQLGGNKE